MKFTQRHGICTLFLDNSHGLSNIVEIHAEIQPKDFFFFFFFGKDVSWSTKLIVVLILICNTLTTL